jgi:hypothetical protein
MKKKVELVVLSDVHLGTMEVFEASHLSISIKPEILVSMVIL